MKRSLSLLFIGFFLIIDGILNSSATAEEVSQPPKTMQTISSSNGAIRVPRLNDGWNCQDKTDEQSQVKISVVACARMSAREFLVVFAADDIQNDPAKATLEVQAKQVLEFFQKDFDKAKMQKPHPINHQGVSGIEIQGTALHRKKVGAKKEAVSLLARVFVKDTHVLIIGVIGSSKLAKKHDVELQTFLAGAQFRQLMSTPPEEPKVQTIEPEPHSPEAQTTKP